MSEHCASKSKADGGFAASGAIDWAMDGDYRWTPLPQLFVARVHVRHSRLMCELIPEHAQPYERGIGLITTDKRSRPSPLNPSHPSAKCPSWAPAHSMQTEKEWYDTFNADGRMLGTAHHYHGTGGGCVATSLVWATRRGTEAPIGGMPQTCDRRHGLQSTHVGASGSRYPT
jgi:hypothetical protein